MLALLMSSHSIINILQFLFCCILCCLNVHSNIVLHCLQFILPHSLTECGTKPGNYRGGKPTSWNSDVFNMIITALPLGHGTSSFFILFIFPPLRYFIVFVVPRLQNVHALYSSEIESFYHHVYGVIVFTN